jgi:hypothetical protein
LLQDAQGVEAAALSLRDSRRVSAFGQPGRALEVRARPPAWQTQPDSQYDSQLAGRLRMRADVDGIFNVKIELWRTPMDVYGR